jgi:hypothetical protein
MGGVSPLGPCWIRMPSAADGPEHQCSWPASPTLLLASMGPARRQVLVRHSAWIVCQDGLLLTWRSRATRNYMACKGQSRIGLD